MAAFPLPLFVRDHPADASAVQDWWDALPEADRAELLVLWSRRGNDCRFTRAPDGDKPGAWRRLPIVTAEFTDDEQPGDDWVPDWIDHLLSNPEEVWVWATHRVIVFRTFHICTAHPAARAVLRAGFIPHDFACPLAAASCPMRKLLAREPGRSVKLRWNGPERTDAREELLP